MRTSQLARTSLLVLTSAVAAVHCSASGSNGVNKNSTDPNEPSGAGGDSVPQIGAGGGGSGPVITGGKKDGGGPTGTKGPSSGLQQVTIDKCPGSVAAGDADKLKAGGPAGSLKWLYPYDGTVFPRGILPPVLQWTPAKSSAADAVYLHLKSHFFEYHGCFGKADPARLPLPKDVWDKALSQSEGAGDPLTVELSTLSGGSASGPVAQKWTVALGSLRGVVYYNTYDSPLAGNKGAVMKIAPGAAAPTAFLTATDSGCISCHSVSANGSALLAAHHFISGGGTDSSGSYDLAGGPSAQPKVLAGTLDEAAFGALYPDGSMFMSMGSPQGGGFGGGFGGFGGGTTTTTGGGNVQQMQGPRDARLFDTKTGTKLVANGWDGKIQHANMPMFAPDGKMIAFNHHDEGQGHSLAVMDFKDPKGMRQFDNLRVLAKDPSLYVGWPVFTADDKSVVYVLGNQTDYTSFSTAARSNLYIVDIATKKVQALDEANGKRGGQVYLPGGARDESLSFYPTMAPVAAGGYSWLFFTSERTYGNTITDDLKPDPNAFNSAISKVKKIWVAAIDLNAPPGKDASHPAFLLPGQELTSGNHRAFPTLDSCLATGKSCSSGTDCCGGFCRDSLCKEPESSSCAELEERCVVDADCCDKTLACVGGYCSLSAPK